MNGDFATWWNYAPWTLIGDSNSIIYVGTAAGDYIHLVGSCGGKAGAGISQQISGFTVSSKYVLQFEASAYKGFEIHGHDGVTGNRGVATVSANGAVVASFNFTTHSVNEGPESEGHLTTSKWDPPFSFEFTAPADTLTLTLTDHVSDPRDCINIARVSVNENGCLPETLQAPVSQKEVGSGSGV